jgi:Flp pilus assembly pilin Flp
MFTSLVSDKDRGERGRSIDMKNYLMRLWKDDQGQSTTEYILILSVVVMVAMKFKKTFEGKLNGILDNLGGQIDQGISSNN